MTTFCRTHRMLLSLTLFGGFFAGCASPHQFTAGRLPYGGNHMAAAAQDPFLAQANAAGHGAQGAETMAMAYPQAGFNPPNGGSFTQAPGANPPGVQNQGAYQPMAPPQGAYVQNGMAQPGFVPNGQPVPPQYAMQATQQPAAPQFQQGYQTAYLGQPPTDPFTTAPPTGPQPMPSQGTMPQNAMPSGPVQPAGGIQQISYEQPVTSQPQASPPMSNPFAEVEGQSPVSWPPREQMPQIVPAGQSADSWQPRATSTSEFLPPQ